MHLAFDARGGGVMWRAAPPRNMLCMGEVTISGTQMSSGDPTSPMSHAHDSQVAAPSHQSFKPALL